jgi:hypothetical protein
MSRRLLQNAGLTLLILMYANPLHAQRSAPIEAMNITGLEGDLLFTGHYRSDEETNSNGRVTDEKDLFFREELGLRSTGYFYHPNLIDWNAGLRLGLTQQRIDINDESFDSDGDITGYNLSALFLKEKPVSMRAYTRKSEDFIDRSFARQIEQSTRVTGAEVYFKGAMPMSLLYEKSDTFEESDTRTDDETTDLLRFQITDDRDTDRFTQFTYEHEDTDKTAIFFLDGEPPVIQDLPDMRDDFRLSNRWRFRDGPNTHSLYGQTRLLRRRGSFDNDLLSFNQRLDLQHSDTLSTFYRAQVLSDDTDSQSEELIDGEVGFIKQYYQSLTVTGRVFASDSQFDTSTEQSVGTFFDFDYLKKTPAGRYSSSLGIGTDVEKQTSESGELGIRDEPVVLAGVTPQRLREPGITPGSVVVTDVNNAVAYIEGLDYRLQQFGQFTEIVRMVTGSIFDGQLVLVDYNAGAAENAHFQTNRIHWRQRLQLQDTPFALISEYRLRDERLESGDDPGNLDREEVILFGLEYREDPITIVGEYEQRDQRLSPSSKSYRIRGIYDQVINDAMNMTFGADYERLDYTNADEFNFEPGRDFLERYGIFGHSTVKLRRDLLARFEASFSDMQGRDNDRLARIGASLNFRRGNMSFTVSGFHEEYEQENETGDSDVIRFTLRRSF